MPEYKVRGFMKLGEVVPGLTQKALRDNGSVKVRMLTQWPTIVGNELAAKASPIEVKFSRKEEASGILHLEVKGGFATEMQMLEPVILEKIAVYFGYRAVHKVVLHQSPKD